jgi:hypothetical protein
MSPRVCSVGVVAFGVDGELCAADPAGRHFVRDARAVIVGLPVLPFGGCCVCQRLKRSLCFYLRGHLVRAE